MDWRSFTKNNNPSVILKDSIVSGYKLPVFNSGMTAGDTGGV